MKNKNPHGTLELAARRHQLRCWRLKHRFLSTLLVRVSHALHPHVSPRYVLSISYREGDSDFRENSPRFPSLCLVLSLSFCIFSPSKQTLSNNTNNNNNTFNISILTPLSPLPPRDKLQPLAGQHVDILETQSPNVRKHEEVLRDLQTHHDKLEDKFLEERASLDAKYQKLYEPLYTKRMSLSAMVRLLPYDLEVMGSNPGNSLSTCGGRTTCIYRPYLIVLWCLQRYEIVNGMVEVEGITNEAVVDKEDRQNYRRERSA